MLKGLIYLGIIVVLTAFTSFRVKPYARLGNAVVVLPGDTTGFSTNISAGWTLLSSYLNKETTDSVVLEIILKQDSAINWRAEQLVGSITNSSFMPKKLQVLSYDLLHDNQWNFRITPGGQCFLSQLKGPPLPVSSLGVSSFVLPIKVRYEVN